MKVEESTKRIRTAELLTKDQVELLWLHKKYNHVILIANLQILAIVGRFLKKLAKYIEPAYTTCCYRLA